MMETIHQRKIMSKEKAVEEVMERLKSDTLQGAGMKADRLDAYRDWVLSLSKEALKGVIIGCAIFRSKNANRRLFSATKKEKQRAGLNVSISNIYLDFAKEIFYCTANAQTELESEVERLKEFTGLDQL